MTPIRTFNAYHLGDNLVHLNFLRRVALANPDRQFIHTMARSYVEKTNIQYAGDVISDIPNIRIGEYGYLEPSDSINAWRGANGCWYGSPIRNDFVKFHLEEWFPRLAKRMGIENPIQSAADMLFDYPAIRTCLSGQFLSSELSLPFDVLLINSPPQSGQFYGYDQPAINSIAWILLNAGRKVISTSPIPGIYDDATRQALRIPCTQTYNLSVTAIGHLSLHCKAILMIAAGPCWTTFNIWNQESIKSRVIWLDVERVNLAPNTVHCTNIPGAALALQKMGMI